MAKSAKGGHKKHRKATLFSFLITAPFTKAALFLCLVDQIHCHVFYRSTMNDSSEALLTLSDYLKGLRFLFAIYDYFS